MSIQKKNSLIVAFFLFQFGFLQPLCVLVDSQLPVAVATVLIMFYALVINRFCCSKYACIIIIAVILCFVSSYVFFPSNRESQLTVFVNFVMKCVPAIFIASLYADYDEIWRYFKVFALINFLCLIWFPAVISIPNTRTLGYMRYGYALLPSVIVFFQEMWRGNGRRTLIYLTLMLVSFAVMFVHGSRGAIVCLAIFVLATVAVYEKNLLRRILYITFIVGTFIILVDGTLPVFLLDKLTEIFGESSYALNKYIMMFERGIVASSSGRGTIYAAAIERIKENILFGAGIGNSLTVAKMTNHNIFLQILDEFGIVGMAMFALLLIYCMYIMIKQNKGTAESTKNILLLLFSVSFGRLLLSSDMWQRPELWMYLTMVIGKPFNKK